MSAMRKGRSTLVFAFETESCPQCGEECWLSPRRHALTVRMLWGLGLAFFGWIAVLVAVLASGHAEARLWPGWLFAGAFATLGLAFLRRAKSWVCERCGIFFRRPTKRPAPAPETEQR